MEHSGIPVDVTSLDRLKSHWNEIQESLITEIDQDYQVFEGRTFKSDRWEHYLISRNIPWPRLESGKLDLKDGTFRDMARSYPEIAPIRELRYNLSQLKLSELAAGQSGRNRCLLSPFASKTGRNQPSNSKYIFGPSTWLRGLIKPGSGMGLAYVDWSQQEFAIGAVLSGDPSMMEAYQSGDPYLEFGKQAGIIPSDGTKETHGAERDRFKTCALGVLYGMGPSLLAQRVGCSDFEARDLLRLHRETYPRFWRWSDGVTAYAELHRKLWTVYGWQIQYNGVVNPRSARNFPSQANAAEMMRLACSIATEKGIRVCGPIHDALLVEFNLDEEEKVIKATQEAMKKASALVLSGFELRSDVSIVRYPDRYMDKRGERMWSTVWKIVYGLMDKNEDR
jgi:hypothetical protein